MSKKGNTKQAFPAGEITTQLSDAISDFGLSHNNETIFPIDFGSNGSCFAVFNLSLHWFFVDIKFSFSDNQTAGDGPTYY